MHTRKNCGLVGEKPIIVFPEWPVDQRGTPNDIPAWYKPPVTRVGTASTIVAEYEVLALRDNQITDHITGIGISLPFRINVLLLHRDSIDDNGSIIDCNHIPRCPDDTFDII